MVISIFIWTMCFSLFCISLFYIKANKKLASILISLAFGIAAIPFIKLAYDIDYVKNTKFAYDKYRQTDYEDLADFIIDVNECNKRIDKLEHASLLDSWIPLFYYEGDLNKTEISIDPLTLQIHIKL